MRNARSAMAVLAIALTTATLGCDGQGPAGRSVRLFTKTAPIEFTFPEGWTPNPKEHPFDLQCLSPSRQMNTGVFVFRMADLEPDTTPTDILWAQVDDIKSKRANVQELEAFEKREYDDKTISSVSYLGDGKDGTRTCYTFSLIEFPQADSPFAVALQVSFPEERQTAKPILDAILQSARPPAASGH